MSQQRPPWAYAHVTNTRFESAVFNAACIHYCYTSNVRLGSVLSPVDENGSACPLGMLYGGDTALGLL
jgi:hypothetical protein